MAGESYTLTINQVALSENDDRGRGGGLEHKILFINLGKK